MIATAGTPAKRRLVQALGATAAVDSRSPDFADEVRALTGGRGCDVVLNSLAGEGQLRSLGCLAPFGRFVEIGKRDIFENAALPLRPFAHNLSFFAFDADQLLAVRPGRVVSLLEETVADHAEGLLPLPPLSLMEAEDPAAAFRVLQRAGHMGKIVLKTPACAEGLEARGPERSPPPREVSAAKGAHDGGDWLLIGGTGGLGRSIAARLAERGAGRIWLVGRRAVPAGSAVETLMAGRAGGGAKIIQRSLDAGDEAALAALLEEIAAAPRPAGAPVLEGIVHAAMVLDDAPLAAMTPERVDRVLAAKTDTALLLDRLTRPLAPRHFVLLGSVAARLGNPGQSAYAAANAGLEALARCRRAAGLPAVALALGPVGDAGHLAAAPERAARIGDSVAHALGSRLLRCSEVLAAFEAALDNPAMPPCCAVMPAGAQLDPAALPIARLPLQARLARKASAAGDLPVEALQTAAAIAALPPDKAPEAIADIIRASLARILRMPAEDVLDTRPLTEMGLDSLMALDLKSTLEDRHGLAVPVAAIGAETTLTGLAGTLAAGLARPEGDHRGGNIGGAGPQPNDPAARGTERAGLAEGDGRSDAAMAASLSSAHAAGLPDELRAELARRLASPRPQGGDTGQRARGSSRMAAGKRAAAR
ncbi:MAG: SDR family NAD(P)-dependent oxidoreductase [Pseudomonadota bacterium]